ncbi:MAG: GNAT family N-acetyltransferase [Leptolyngbya sp. SIO3F4]|nr:GNAT family N-acetyltransferase [Leptolyngbya sp. SIO3F4]
MLEILSATEHEQLAQVRSLMHAFIDWLRQHYANDTQLINEYFDEKAFSEELLLLPGKYATPDGQLLLALYQGQSAGCVGLRKLDDHSCEMKRLFVPTQFHGQGIGRALVETLLQNARTLGYKSIRLDTGIHQTVAQTLYQSLGFKIIQPYYEVSANLEKGLVFMELIL